MTLYNKQTCKKNKRHCHEAAG